MFGRHCLVKPHNTNIFTKRNISILLTLGSPVSLACSLFKTGILKVIEFSEER